MKFEITGFEKIPKGCDFLQAIVSSNLKMDQLFEKYGFRFTNAIDDLGEVDTCLICDENANLFLIVCREIYPEHLTTIYCNRTTEEFELYVKKQFLKFVECTNFKYEDLVPIWNFIEIPSSEPVKKS